MGLGLAAAACLAAALAAADDGAEDLYAEFQDLEPLKADDSWLDLDTWNPMRVGDFITHIEREFPDIALSGAQWREKSITGMYLKTQIWGDLDEKMLGHLKFEDNEQKFIDLGFSEDKDVRAEQIKRVRARIDKEYLRRRDAKFRKKLAKNKEEQKIKAAKRLGIEPGEVPDREKFDTYKVRELRLLFEANGLNPAKYGKEVGELKQKALEKFYGEGKKKKKKKGKKKKQDEKKDEEEL